MADYSDYWRRQAARLPGSQISNPPPMSNWQILANAVKDTFNEAGDGLNALFLRSNRQARDEEVIRSDLQNRGATPEQADKAVQQNRQQDAKAIRETRAAKILYTQDDERRQPDKTITSRALRGSARLAGQFIGDINPTYAIPAVGETALGRTAAMGTVSGANDLFSQTSDVNAGIRDDYDPYEFLGSTTAGAAFQGAGEAIGKGLGKLAGRNLIARGRAHDNYEDINDSILAAEGGGTIDEPKVSSKGAVGPQQVMMATAKKPGFGIKPWNGKTQEDLARVGREYSAALTAKYDGDPTKVFAAYNAGYGKVDKLIAEHGEGWFHHLPSETKQYIDRALTHYEGPGHGSTGGPVPVLETKDMADVMHDPEAMGYDLAETEGPENLGESNITQEEQPSISEQARVNDAFTPPENVHEFPGDRIVNPETAGPSSDIPFRMTKESGISNIDDARHARYTREMEENNKKLAASDDEYLNDLRERADNMRNILDDHREGRPVMSMGELVDARYEWAALAHRMEMSKMPPLGQKEVKGVLKHFDDFFEDQKLAEGTRNPDFISPYDNYNDRFTKPLEQPNFSNDNPPEKKSFLDNFKAMMKDDSGAASTDETPSYVDHDYADLDPEQKLVKAIKETRPASNESKSAIHEARKRQAGVLSGLQAKGAGLHEQLRHLSGDIRGADLEPIRHNFTDEDVHALEQKINENQSLREFEKVNALRTLHKLLSPDGVKIPTPLELKNLGEVMHPDVIKALMERHQTLGKTVIDALNLPRTVMSAGDISAPARQGWFFVTRKAFWTNYPKMIQMLGSERAYNEMLKEITTRPTYGAMKDSGLFFGHKGADITGREEAFMSNLAKRIPIIGHVIKASDRAYTGYLDRLRADMFDTLYYKGNDLGIHWEGDRNKLRTLGNYINTGSGRGSLGQFEQAATAASTIFFSPRLIASRVNLLNPVYYAKLYKADPFMARQGIRDLAGMALVSSALLGIAHEALGASVELDPRSTDFGKAKIGNIRIDPLGGFQPYMRLISQMVMGQDKDSHGKIRDLSNPKFGQPTRFDKAVDFGKNKLAPLPGYLANWASQTKYRKFDKVNEAAKLLLPMYAPDIREAIKEEGASGAWVAIPSVLGFGVQVYKTKKAKKKHKEWYN